MSPARLRKTETETAPKKPRKTPAQKKQEAEVTTSSTEQTPPQPETGSSDPDASQAAQPTEGESAPDPDQGENPGPTDQEKFDASQAEAQQAEQSDDQSETEWPNSANYQPTHRPLQAAGLDQQAAHDAREAERAAQRDEHNERTASGILETQRGGRKVG